MEFNNRNLDKIRKDLEILLKQYGSENGDIEFKMGRISYSSNHISCKLEAFTGAENGESSIDKVYVDNFNRFRDFYGINKDIKVNDEIKKSGKTFRLIGIDIKQRKNKIKLQDVNTKQYVKCNTDWLNFYASKN